MSRRLPACLPHLLALFASLFLFACGGGGQPGTGDGGTACTRSRDCPSGMGCVSQVCVALPCGGCQADELCADNGSCIVAQGSACPMAGCPTGYSCSAGVCSKPCTLDQDCDKNFVCNSALHTCAQCTFDNQCTQVTGKHRCDAATGNCVACTQPSDCGHGSFCDTTAHACQAGCKLDGDCNVAGGERCDGATAAAPGRCIQCATDNDCKSGGAATATPACDSTGHCVGCTNDSYCPVGQGVPRCDTTSKTCVQCLAADNATGKDCGCATVGLPSSCPANTTTGDPHTGLTCQADTHACVPGCQFDTQCGCPHDKTTGLELNCGRAPHRNCSTAADCNTAAGDTCVGATASAKGLCTNGSKTVVVAEEYCDPNRRTNNNGASSFGACGECTTDAHCRYRKSDAGGLYADQNGSRCVNARCVEGCDTNDDCPGSKVCHIGTPGITDANDHKCVECGCDGAATGDSGSWCLDSVHCGPSTAASPKVCDAKTLLCRKKRFAETCDTSAQCGDINDPAINANGSTSCLPASLCVKDYYADVVDQGTPVQCKTPGLPQGRCGIPCANRSTNSCINGDPQGACPPNSLCRGSQDGNGGTGAYCVPAGCR